MQIGTFPGWHGEDAGDPPKIAVCRLHMQTRRSRSYCVSNYAWFSKCDMHFEKLHKRSPPILTSPVPCRTHASTLAGKQKYSKNTAKGPLRACRFGKLLHFASTKLLTHAQASGVRAEGAALAPGPHVHAGWRIAQRLAPPCRHTQLAVCLLQITVVDVHGNMIWN